jgi:septal ring factor EnvC (AmiA/AmiB activator)
VTELFIMVLFALLFSVLLIVIFRKIVKGVTDGQDLALDDLKAKRNMIETVKKDMRRMARTNDELLRSLANIRLENEMLTQKVLELSVALTEASAKNIMCLQEFDSYKVVHKQDPVSSS